MPDINWQLSAEASKAMVEVARLGLEYQKLGGSIKGATGESTRGAAAFAGALGQIKGMVGGLIGTGSILSAINMNAEAMKGLNKEASAFEDAIKRISAFGVGGGTFRKAAGEVMTLVGAEHLPLADRAALLETARKTAPMATEEQIKGIAGAAARATIPYGKEAGPRMAGIMGELSKIMPGRTAGDLGDIGMLLMQTAGRRGEAFEGEAAKGLTQLVTLGKSPEEALSIAMAALESGQGGRGLAAYATFTEAQAQAAKSMKTKRAFERRAVPPAVQAIQAQLGRRDYGAMLREAAAGDLLTRTVETGLAEPEIAIDYRMGVSRADVEKMRYRRHEEAERADAARAFMEKGMEEQGMAEWRRHLRRTEFGYALGIGLGPEGALKHVGLSEKGFNRWYDQEGRPEGRTEGLGLSRLEKELVKNSEALKENTEATKRNSQVTSPTTGRGAPVRPPGGEP